MTLKFINNWISKYEKGGLEWAIELKENHQVIGMISADKSYKYKCVEIGYSISSKYWNIGLITDALKEVVKYLLNECDYDVIEAIIPSNNIGIIRVAEKCGLILEATLKNRYKDNDGIVQDLCIYSIIK